MPLCIQVFSDLDYFGREGKIEENWDYRGIVFKYLLIDVSVHKNVRNIKFFNLNKLFSMSCRLKVAIRKCMKTCTARTQDCCLKKANRIVMFATRLTNKSQES